MKTSEPANEPLDQQPEEALVAELVEDGVDEPVLMGLALPDDPAEARDILVHELGEARRESGQLLEDLQRVVADFANYRKRVERDQADNVLRASQRVIEALLPTLDSLDAALTIEATSDTEKQLLGGIHSVQGQLLDALAREGFEPIDASPGVAFDPAVHEAVAGPGGDGELVVGKEMRRGYTMRNRVIRPALVMVDAR